MGDGHGGQGQDGHSQGQEQPLFKLTPARRFLGGDFEEAQRRKRHDWRADAIEQVQHDGYAGGEEADEHERIGKGDGGKHV